MTKEGNEEDIQKIIDSFNNNRFATSIALMSVLLQKNEHDGQSNNILQLLADGIVKIAENDDQEINNLGFAFYKLKRFPEAISVFKFLTERNPSKIAQRITLLQLYKDAGMTDDFAGFKKDLLANYQLSKEERNTIETV
jgi:tetratricopeptide (TPR) repeat protein